MGGKHFLGIWRILLMEGGSLYGEFTIFEVNDQENMVVIRKIHHKIAITRKKANLRCEEQLIFRKPANSLDEASTSSSSCASSSSGDVLQER